MSKTQIVTGGIADDAVSEEHLDATAITGSTELASAPADTDEILISDAGTLKRIDFSLLKTVNTPAWAVTMNGTQSGLSQNGTFGLLMTAVFSRKIGVSKSQNIYI